MPDGQQRVGINEYYSYDAYGVMVDGNPTRGSTPATNLLYSGEQFDVDAQQYYLRARYYDPLNGRFNQMDPFGGNNQDPQSLHKYLYCHANPVNGTDPSGRSFGGFAIGVAIIAIVAFILYFAVYRPTVKPIALMLKAQEIDSEILEGAVGAMRIYWPGIAKMINLANGLADNTYRVLVFPRDSRIQGMNLRLDAYTLYISESSTQYGDVATALVIFAEFQHNPAGGGLNEEDAQGEFVEIRNMLPANVRNDYINGLSHGGIEND